MTTAATDAFHAVIQHHRILNDELNERVSALAGAVRAGEPHEPGTAALVAYLTGEVLPHAAAEENTMYPAAAAHSELAGTVSEMTAEHRALSAATERLASAASGSAAVDQAYEIASLFTEHVEKENDVLLPALLADGETDLAALLAAMHRCTSEVAQVPRGEEAGTGDPQQAVVSLLLQAAAALAEVGQADRACRLAALAWAALRSSRPDLAVKVTAALHRLVRQAAGERSAQPGAAGERSAHFTRGEVLARPAANGSGTKGDHRAPGADFDLDVRHLAPAQRHGTIFATYASLPPGGGFILINDHDPKPLRYQFEAEHAGEFGWDTLEAGPVVWRVRIGRAGPQPA